MVFDKSDKHATNYDRYNAEVASTSIQIVSMEIIMNLYSIAKELKFDVSDAIKKCANNLSRRTVRAALSLRSLITPPTT